ncbi:hypothetical protein OSTOST_06031, partial [Ostertagia ostertagi]
TEDYAGIPAIDYYFLWHLLTFFTQLQVALPYTIFLLAHWNPTYFDLDPCFVLISSTPLVVQLKIHLTLTISIAFERTLALLFPIIFRKLSLSSYAMYCLLIGCLLGILDLIVEYLLTPLERKPNCAAIGCFISREFRYYWGASNMVSQFRDYLSLRMFYG